MRIHHYHPELGHHLDSSDAHPNPMEHELAKLEDREVDPAEAWIVPAHATTAAPPKVEDGQVAVFDAAAGAWTVKASAEIEAAAEAARPKPTDEQLWARVRALRDHQLASSDWTQLPDAPLSDDQRAAWRAARQGLRDLPQNESDPTVALALVTPLSAT